MLVKFGYCIICDNGPDKENRHWVEDLIKVNMLVTPSIKNCTNCKTEVPNKNLLWLEVEVI